MAGEISEGDESTHLGQRTEAEIRELMGLFDAPAFARRGHAMEFNLALVKDRCRVNRSQMLDMVRMRLKQWSQASDGPEAWREVFVDSIAGLWPLCEADDPAWAENAQPIRRRRTIAKDLIASVQRFNARWSLHLLKLNLEPVNEMIRQYNQFYILEKECVLGSSRLAARFFRPEPELTPGLLLQVYPILPVPELAA